MLNPSRWLKAIFGSPEAKSPIAKKRVAVRLGFDPLEDRLVPTAGFFGGAFDTVVADTKALGQLVVAPNGLRTLAATSISNAAQSFQNAAQNAPEALELGSIATKNLSNGINHFWDTYAGGDTLLDKVPAFVGKSLTSEVTGTLDALSAVTHVTSKVTTVVRDHANGKAVGTADVVNAAWQGIKDKKVDLTQAVLSVATGRIADKVGKLVVSETPGRKPQQVLTSLIGQHAKDTDVRNAVKQVVSTVLDTAANSLLASPKSSPAIASGHASGSSSSRAQPTATPPKSQAAPAASSGHNSGSSSSAPAHPSQPAAPAPKVTPVVKATPAPAPKPAPSPAKPAAPVKHK